MIHIGTDVLLGAFIKVTGLEFWNSKWLRLTDKSPLLTDFCALKFQWKFPYSEKVIWLKPSDDLQAWI